MKSMVCNTGDIDLPKITGHLSMVHFNLLTLEGLDNISKNIVSVMLKGIDITKGKAYFTLHGRQLNKGETLRRGGAHTDGSFDHSGGGGNGWKIGENGPPVGSENHSRLYASERGGIILASNFESCLGWEGDFEGLPSVGGDCSHIDLTDGFMLDKNKIYYGNNHFIHESLPMSDDVHRVFARITLPEDHIYKGVK